MRNFKYLLLVFLLLAIPTYAGKIENSEQLISEMHKKYKKKWYKTLTFVQKNTQFSPTGETKNSVWYEAMSLPGKLRIDIAPLEKNNGMIFADDKQHIVRDGKVANSRPSIHPLLVLGFDVYQQEAKTTIKQLKELKFDLSIFRKDELNGRSVYVVGAKKGDLKTKQFWIDKKNLYLIKTIQAAGKDGKSTQEIQFNKYQKVKGGGWIAPEVVFIVDGKKVFLEEYSEMKFNQKLDANLFDPTKWSEVSKDYFKLKK